MHPGFFYMPQICDMGPIILLPLRAEDFLSPFKNPTASAGFEPANLGIRGQHATSAPPKPLSGVLNYPEPLGPPRPVAGHLYFTLLFIVANNNSSELEGYVW